MRRRRASSSSPRPPMDAGLVAPEIGRGCCLTFGSYFLNYETIVKSLPLATLVAKPEHVDAFKALAHGGRLDVFFTLVKARRPLAVGEIQEALDIPGPTLSHHLDQLRRARLVEAKREERFIYYSVGPMVTDLVRLLTACC